MSQTLAVKFPVPRRKKRRRTEHSFAPFPLPTSKSRKWSYYSGKLQGNHVIVEYSGDAYDLYTKGCFGKGTMSRSLPEFQNLQPVIHIPKDNKLIQLKIMKLGRYFTHHKWKKCALTDDLSLLDDDDDVGDNSDDDGGAGGGGDNHTAADVVDVGHDDVGDNSDDDGGAGGGGDNHTAADVVDVGHDDVGDNSDDDGGAGGGGDNHTAADVVDVGHDDVGDNSDDDGGAGGGGDNHTAADVVDVGHDDDDNSDDGGGGGGANHTAADVDVGHDDDGDSGAVNDGGDDDDDGDKKDHTAADGCDVENEVLPEVLSQTQSNDGTKTQESTLEHSKDTNPLKQIKKISLHSMCKIDEDAADTFVVDRRQLESENTEDNSRQSTQWLPSLKKDPYSVEEALLLTYEEAFFLAYGLGCLLIKDSQGNPLKISELWKTFYQWRSDFLAKYIAYHYYRSQGWIPKPGIKYGSEYILYKEGQLFYHATYSVLVFMVEEGSLEEDHQRTVRNMDWITLAGLDRMNEHVSKQLMFCYVIKPKNITENELLSPNCISRFKIQEMFVTRWISNQDREKKTDKLPEEFP